MNTLFWTLTTTTLFGVLLILGGLTRAARESQSKLEQRSLDLMGIGLYGTATLLFASLLLTVAAGLGMIYGTTTCVMLPFTGCDTPIFGIDGLIPGAIIGAVFFLILPGLKLADDAWQHRKQAVRPEPTDENVETDEMVVLPERTGLIFYFAFAFGQIVSVPSRVKTFIAAWFQQRPYMTIAVLLEFLLVNLRAVFDALANQNVSHYFVLLLSGLGFSAIGMFITIVATTPTKRCALAFWHCIAQSRWVILEGTIWFGWAIRTMSMYKNTSTKPVEPTQVTVVPPPAPNNIIRWKHDA